jgi:hypothetical protein
MKKMLFILMALLVAAPAMALTLGETAKSGTTVTVTYDAAGGAFPRAFGLVLQATGGTITSVTAAKTGESVTGSKGFGIFPGTIDINSVTGVVDSYGSPVEPNALPGGPSATGTSRVVVALGSLYGPGDANKPDPSGNLFTVVCSAGTTALSVSEEETYRGGVVDVNAVGLTVATLNITFAVPETIIGTPVVTKTTAAPAIAGRVNAVRSETFSTTAVTGSLGGTIEYQFTFGSEGTSAWSTATTASHTFATATTSAWTANVTVQARLQATPTTFADSAAIVETGEAVKSTSTTIYAAWADFGRPVCWGYQRNCRGDADGLGGGIGAAKVWTNAADLNILAAGFSKNVAALKVASFGGVAAICADFNRLGGGIGAAKVWVNADDLNILALYFSKNVSLNPVCDATWQSNYNYWTN